VNQTQQQPSCLFFGDPIRHNVKQPPSENTTMLAEKFILVLETLRSNAPSDNVIVSGAPHIPVKLPLSRTYLLFQNRSFVRQAEATANFSPI
jgi:hypothetical protein